MRLHLAMLSLLVVTAVAYAQPRVRWTQHARGGPDVAFEGRWTHAEVLPGGDVRVTVTDLSDAVVFETTVVGPHWRSSVGEACQAMGIAGADFVRIRGRLHVRVQVSVSDLCERRAPAYTLVPLPPLAP